MNAGTIKIKQNRVTRKATASGYFANNKVNLIKGGGDYFDLLENLIQNARESIHLQTYIFEADKTGIRVSNALIQAAKKKVKVAILLDGYASQHFPHWMIDTFNQVGIHFGWFQPLWKTKKFYFGRRLHHKIVVIDGQKVLVGGLNISDRYNDTPEQKAWLDWAVYAEGDVAAAAKKLCQRRSKITWTNKAHTLSDTVITRETDCKECNVRIRINDWVNRKMQISNSYMEMIRKANSRIIIMSPYFMPGRSFRKKLTEAANRGVRVMIVLGSKSDVALARYAEQYLYPWLLRNKIEIYEYQKNVLHGKMATYDGVWVTTGSYNFNNISAYASVELNLDVDDTSFAQKVEHELDFIMREQCQQITIDNYRKRANLYQRFLQRSAYDIIRMLFFVFTFYFRQKD